MWTKLYASAQMKARNAHASLIFAGFPLWRASHRPFSRPLSLRRAASCPRSTHFLPPTRDQTARIQNRIFPRHAPWFPQSRFPLSDYRHATLLSVLFLIVYRFFAPDRLYAYIHVDPATVPLNHFHRCTLEMLRFPLYHSSPPWQLLLFDRVPYIPLFEIHVEDWGAVHALYVFLSALVRMKGN